ncbi:Stk1 family PASTA domain-containing Ser/Thr kinase [Heliorestis acidaminivorans]|nr:Stk1 family PASTA domain-containing Ser/Thr kinase [Heliorestis acidaminivorans]
MKGRIFGNRYEIVEYLGGGGMAQVYKSWDRVLERAVTIKFLREGLTNDEEFVRRFRREAQAIASLSHPNIVNVYDVGREGETDYIVMEYIDGPTLKEVIRRNGSLEPVEAVNLARQICDALEHAHEKGIIHRDIKPHNILLTASGRVKVTDFGIARSTTQNTMTMDRTIVGSVHYLSPEQARGLPVDEKSDIYSLGVVLYELLSGHVPFQGETPIAVALQQVQQNPPPISKSTPEIPRTLEEVVMRTLEKNPERRYGNAKALKDDLDHVFSGTIVGRLPLEDDSPTVRLEQPLPWQEHGKLETREPSYSNNKNEKEEPTARINWKIVLSSLLLLALIAFASTFAWQRYMNVPEVMLPRVVDMHYMEAIEAIENVGLQVQVERVNHNQIAREVVISQDPEGNRMVKATREVRLTVSLGPKLDRVPYVTGMTQREALIKLQEAEFSYDVVEEYDNRRPAGTVISQKPAANTEQPIGTIIELLVSRGPENQPIMPALTGLSIEEAKTVLAPLEVRIEQREEASDSFGQGLIIGQNPASNSNVEKGSTVTITISTGAEEKKAEIEKKKTTVTIMIPEERTESKVRIILQQGAETIEAYSGTHAGGDAVTRQVEYQGRAIIQGFLDGEKVFERQVE